MSPDHPTAMSDRATPELESLLSHMGWVRALAQNLVADPHLAEDLVQETYAAALRRPPVGERHLRGWLRKVLRNFVRQFRRGEERRRSREQDASREESLPGAAELVERVSIQKLVVEAVLELPEPYRTTVLMRWFEELPPRAIARRHGVPVATVHTRLARAHERLRASLDRLHPDRRQGWIAALSLPLESLGGQTATTLGVLLVDAKLKAGVAGLLLTAGLFATWAWIGSAGVEPKPALHAPAEAARAESASGDTGKSAAVEGALRRAAPAPAPTTASLPAAARRVRGKVLDVQARPAAGVRVRVAGIGNDGASAESDPSGRFELEAPAGGGEIVAASPGLVTVLSGVFSPTSSTAEPVLVVAPAISLAGRVVDESGAPVRSARLRVYLPEGFRSRFHDVLDFSEERSVSAETDLGGWFDLAEVPLVPGSTLQVHADGFRPHKRALPDASDRAIQVVLERPSTLEGHLLGQVIDAAGALVPEAKVSLGLTTAITDEQGAFRLRVKKGGTDRRLIAMKQGYLPAVKEALPGDEVRWPDFVVLELGGAPLSLHGTVVDEGGTALPGIKLWLADPLFFGLVDGSSATAESYLSGAATHSQLEKLTAGLKEPREQAAVFRKTPTVTWGWVVTDAAGRFALAGLLPRDYRVIAMDPATLLRVVAGPLQAGSSGHRIVLPTRSVFEKVAGRVVSRSGRPVEGVRVGLATDAITLGAVTMVADRSGSESEAVVTDAGGRFELARVPREGVYLTLDADSILPRDFGRNVPGGIGEIAKGSVDKLEIAVSLRIHVRVEIQPETVADRLAVLDRADKPLPITVFQGHGSSTSTRIDVKDGKVGILSVPEDAVALVLYSGNAEVRRTPLALKPGEVNVVRP